MNALTRFSLWALTGAALIATVACNNSSSSPAPASAAAVLSLAPSPATVSPGQSILLTPSGGSPPYNFILLSNIGGSISQNSGTFTVFTAPGTSGAVELQVTDSASNTQSFIVSVGGSLGGTLSLSPLNTTVAPGGTVVFTASGGSPPYNYSVLTSGGGSFNGAVFYASSTSQTVSVQATDSSGQSYQTTVVISGTATSASNCGGTFNMFVDGYPAILSIVENSSGTIGGSITENDANGNPSSSAISGSCNSSGSISFTDLYSGSPYTGTFFVNPNNAAQIVMSGNFTYNSTSYPWSAQSQ